jgi:hypothetical protein
LALGEVLERPREVVSNRAGGRAALGGHLCSHVEGLTRSVNVAFSFPAA